MMLTEWVSAFDEYSPEHMHEAISRSFKTCKFWPSIAEITEHLREIRKETIAEIEHVTGGKRFRGDGIEFAKNGRTEVEEIAKRVADCKKWRQESGAFEIMPPEDTHKPKEASQEMSMSHSLKTSKVARRALGENI